MRTILLTLALGFVAACGDDGSTNSKVDAPTGGADAPVVVIVDAPPVGVETLGKACTPGAGQTPEQGDCPTGYLCLNLQGGTHAWCSKTCTSGAGDTCNAGYAGPGIGNCFLSVGGTTYCGVVCADTTASHTVCPTCNNTCPGTPALACTAALDGPGTIKGCQ